MTDYICDNCGHSFSRKYQRGQKYRFCSVECRIDYQKTHRLGGRGFVSISVGVCRTCGRIVYRATNQQLSQNLFCDRLCLSNRPEELRYSIKKGERVVFVDGRREVISTCYFKEARAILDGKHWQGKNKCVSLPGD